MNSVTVSYSLVELGLKVSLLPAVSFLILLVAGAIWHLLSLSKYSILSFYSFIYKINNKQMNK